MVFKRLFREKGRVSKPSRRNSEDTVDSDLEIFPETVYDRGDDISSMHYGESVGSTKYNNRKGTETNATKKARAELNILVPYSTDGDISLIGGSMDEGSVIVEKHKSRMLGSIIGDGIQEEEHENEEVEVEDRPKADEGTIEDGVEVYKVNNSGGKRLSTDLSIFYLSLLKDENSLEAKSLPERIVRDSLQSHLDLYLGRSTNTTKTDDKNEQIDIDLCLKKDPEKIEALAQDFLTKGQYEQSITVYHLLLEKQRKLADAETSETLGKLAILHLREGHLNRSMIFAKEALRLNREESKRAETTMNLMVVSLVYFYGNKMDKALTTWREALQNACLVYGYDHPNVAVLLNNIGCLYYHQGDFAASLRAFSESLDLQKTFLRSAIGITDLVLVDMAITKGNIAMITAGNGDVDAAISLFEEVLSIQESVISDREHFLVTTYTMECLNGTRQEMSAPPNQNFFFSVSSVAGMSKANTENAFVGLSDTFPFLEASESKVTSVFGDNDGIPMRRVGANSPLYAMDETDNLDVIMLGSLANEYTPRQRVRTAVLAWFGKTLQEDEDRQLPFVPFEKTQRKRPRVPVDLDHDNVIDAELYLAEIHQQAHGHLEVSAAVTAVKMVWFSGPQQE
jgi:tetratricopeptide (TPR) repeat protein